MAPALFIHFCSNITHLVLHPAPALNLFPWDKE
jgi:hypothetical protein